MTVDIVIVTYRSAESIQECLDSTATLPDAHVVVVENDSGDETPQIARDFGAEVVVNTTNLGFGQAANQGARRGSGEAILFLNPDAILGPDTLDRMMTVLDEPGVGIVGATLVYPDGRPQRSWWPYPSATDLWSEAVGLKRLRREPTTGFVVGACFLVRRDVFERLGGFDARFWLYGEETDLCFRADQLGWQVRLATDAICRHSSGLSGRDSSELVAQHFALGSERFVALHRGPGALFSYRFAGLVGSAIRWPVLRLLRPADERIAVRRRQIRRLVSVLLRHPFGLGPVERPDHERSWTVVLLSLEAWDEVWRRNQLLVRELLAADPQLRVLWVEPPHDVLHSARRERSLPRLGTTARRPVPGYERVLRMQPRKVLPRAVWPFVDRSLVRQVRRAMRDEGFTDATLWINDSTYASLMTNTTNRAVYDITDDWLDASGTPREVSRREHREDVMLSTADAVVVCSAELARRRSVRSDVVLIPNAVDADHFRTPQPRPADLPQGAVAVYVGTLHDDRLDVDLVERLSEQLPEVDLVFVGPQLLSTGSTARLQRPNVHLLGTRPYAAVPGYLQHADVIVIPHVVSAFTRSLDPIKAYECLAVGRPTLAVPLEGFVGLGPPIETAEPSDFPDRLRALLAAGTETVQPSVPTWTERASQFAEILWGASTIGTTGARLHVMIVGHTAIASGAEIALTRLVPGLVGSDVLVVLGEDGPVVPLLVRAGARVQVLPMAAEARTVKRTSVAPGALPLGAALATARYVVRLRRLIRAEHPDVVHTNSLKAAIYGGVAARLAGVPVMWHVRDRIAEDYLPAKAVSLIRALARVVPTEIVANSRSTAETLVAGRRSERRRITVVHDPLASAVPTPPPHNVAPVLAIIGRIAPWKGQDVFLRAFAAAFPSGEVTALVVGAPLFGEHEFEAELHGLARALGIGDRVTFTGHRDDVPAILSGVDIVVHSSVIPEPFGQVVVEAMAAGRAVIAAAAGGPLEIISDGVDGLLVAPGAVEDLAAAMGRLAADPALRAELGAAAVHRAADFDPIVIGAQIERVYRRLAARRSAARA